MHAQHLCVRYTPPSATYRGHNNPPLLITNLINSSLLWCVRKRCCCPVFWMYSQAPGRYILRHQGNTFRRALVNFIDPL